MANQDSLPQSETGAEPEYSEWRSYQEPDSLMKEIARAAREEAELLETDPEGESEGESEDEKEDEYGMTAKGEVEPLGFVVETERNF